MVALAGGSGAAPTSASAGSTGEEPAESVIAGATRMGTVELHTADLDAMTDFYVGGVGLVPLSEDEPSVALGADVDADAGASAEELIRLVGVDAPTANPADAGLYHTAIRFPDEPALARALLRVGSLYPSAYQGSADHAVSLAFYFADPEGNGVELYVDRPRNEWVWQDGEVQMGSAALDPNAFLEEHLDGETAGIADVGHVHLKVGDLDIAREFYEGVLGFAVTAEADGAIFLSAGGYHHHLAANTWGSAGAGARQTTLGLGSVEVVVPVASDLDALVARLDAAGVGYEHTDSALTVADPWGTRVAFRIEA
ncbi:VOC family protein [Agromyces humatus]|uniref:VOC family protein n=2 Tax=Agromyces humatus TaxID=279573 RepID=A0ABP4WKQ3_9MICO